MSVPVPRPRLSLPRLSAEPMHVSVTRGGAEESCHLVDVALCDADGTILSALARLNGWYFRDLR